MTLNQYAAERRLAIHADLIAGKAPLEPEFDEALFREARTRGAPQMGTTRYEPHALIFEFIYPDPQQTAIVLSVRCASPERIVFMPVPAWVVENIWQGDIDGSYHFESAAGHLLADFEQELGPEANQKWFAPRPRTRRE